MTLVAWPGEPGVYAFGFAPPSTLGESAERRRPLREALTFGLRSCGNLEEILEKSWGNLGDFWGISGEILLDIMGI